MEFQLVFIYKLLEHINSLYLDSLKRFFIDYFLKHYSVLTPYFYEGDFIWHQKKDSSHIISEEVSWTFGFSCLKHLVPSKRRKACLFWKFFFERAKHAWKIFLRKWSFSQEKIDASSVLLGARHEVFQSSYLRKHFCSTIRCARCDQYYRGQTILFTWTSKTTFNYIYLLALNRDYELYRLIITMVLLLNC